MGNLSWLGFPLALFVVHMGLYYFREWKKKRGE